MVLFEGIPAVIYTGLWSLKIFKKLEKVFPKLPKTLLFLLTDSPPAFLVKIDKTDFEIELLEGITESDELDDIECDAYLGLPTDILYEGGKGIMDGIAENKVKIKNYDILTILLKLAGGVV
jgi:hypothetical protein